MFSINLQIVLQHTMIPQLAKLIHIQVECKEYIIIRDRKDYRIQTYRRFFRRRQNKLMLYRESSRLEIQSDSFRSNHVRRLCLVHRVQFFTYYSVIFCWSWDKIRVGTLEKAVLIPGSCDNWTDVDAGTKKKNAVCT